MVFLVFLLAAGTVEAARRPLLTEFKDQRAAAFRLRRAETRARRVIVDLSAIVPADAQDGADAIDVDLFPDVAFTATKTRFERRNARNSTWFGKVPDDPKSSVILVSGEGRLRGSIFAHGKHYAIREADGASQVAVEIDQSAFPSEACDQAQDDGIPFEGPLPLPDVQGDSGAVIDVMVVYTPSASAVEGGATGMNNLIALAVAETNASYGSSLIAPRLNLVHAAEVAYTETGNWSLDLDRLRQPSDGFIDGVHALRDTYSADVVVMVINDDAYCGIAYLNAAATTAFALVDNDCATGYYSFGHEIGHLQGARHDWYVDTTPGYNHGHVDLPSRQRTVMAYNSECSNSGFNCTRVPFWSNPNINYPYNGYDPTPNPTGTLAREYNALVLNNSAVTVANFRQGLHTLTVESTYPGVDVPMTVTPLDESSLGDGNTTLTRVYPSGTNVTVTAPLTADGNPFGAWSGCTSTSGTSGSVCSVTMDSAKTITATYARDLNARPIASLLWSRSDSGKAVIKEVDPGSGILQKTVWISAAGQGATWKATSYTRIDATVGYVLWTSSTAGQAILWEVNPSTGALTSWNWISPPSGVGGGWLASGYEHGTAATGYVLWTNAGSGQAVLWNINPGTGALNSWAWISSSAGVGAGWLASSYAHVDSTTGYVLWSNGGTGEAVLWKVAPGGVSGTIPLTSWSSLPAVPGQEATDYTALDASTGYVLRSGSTSGSADSWILDPATGQGSVIVPSSASGPGGGWSATGFSGAWALVGEPGVPVVPAASTTGSYTVSWDTSTLPAPVYRLEESTSSGFTEALRIAYEGTELSASISGGLHGATYYYRVQAMASGYPDSSWSVGANGCVVNDWPTLNALSPLTINEDSGLQTVALGGITAGLGESQTLTVTATSSNSGLFPNPTVLYTSPASTGSIRFTPAANAYGTSTVTVTVNDGQAANNTAVQTFLVTVNPVNDVPSFTKGANQTVLEDAGTQSVVGWATGISAGPTNEDGQILTFIVTNNNNGLFAAQPALATNGTLTYTPASDANGSATVSVQLLDDGGTLYGGQDTSAAQSFTITVTAVNDPPTLNALSPLTIEEDAGLQTVGLSGIAAGGGESQALTVTATSSNTGLVPNPDVSYTSPNPTGNLSFTPVANANGTATVTVTVNDGQAASNTVVQTFLVTVNAVNDPPTAILLSSNMVNMGAPAGTRVGTLSTTDPDGGDTFVYSIVGGDTTMFRIDGNLLETDQVLDYAVNPYTVRIRSTDAGLSWTEQDFTIVPPSYVLWTNVSKGQAIRWMIDPTTGAMTDWAWLSPATGVGAGWLASSYAKGTITDTVLWTNVSTGQAIRWQVDPATGALTDWAWISPTTGVGAGWQASSYARGDATADYVLWTNSSTGQAIRWQVDPATGGMTDWAWISPATGVGAGWQASSYARGDATADYVLWINSSTGQAIRWQVDPTTGAMTDWAWISPAAGVGAGWQASSI